MKNPTAFSLSLITILTISCIDFVFSQELNYKLKRTSISSSGARAPLSNFGLLSSLGQTQIIGKGLSDNQAYNLSAGFLAYSKIEWLREITGKCSFDWNCNDYLSAVITENQAAYVTGMKSNYGNEDVYIAKYLPDGTELWNTTWDNISYQNDDAGYVISLSSDYLYIGGATKIADTDTDSLILKYDLSTVPSSLTWSSTWSCVSYGENCQGNYEEIDGVYFYDNALGDKSSYAVSWTGRLAAAVAVKSIWGLFELCDENEIFIATSLIKLDDQNGSINNSSIWNDFTYFQEPNGMVLDTQGNLYIAGHRSNGSAFCGGDVFLAKFHFDFNSQEFINDWVSFWDSDDVASTPAVSLHLALYNDSFLYVTGYANKRIFLLKYNLKGEKIWEFILPPVGSKEYSRAIAVDEKGVFIVGNTKPVSRLDSYTMESAILSSLNSSSSKGKSSLHTQIASRTIIDDSYLTKDPKNIVFLNFDHAGNLINQSSLRYKKEKNITAHEAAIAGLYTYVVGETNEGSVYMLYRDGFIMRLRRRFY